MKSYNRFCITSCVHTSVSIWLTWSLKILFNFNIKDKNKSFGIDIKRCRIISVSDDNEQDEVRDTEDGFFEWFVKTGFKLISLVKKEGVGGGRLLHRIKWDSKVVIMTELKNYKEERKT